MPFDVIWRNAPLLASGLALTVLISAIAIVAGIAIGVPVAAMRMSHSRVARAAAGAYIDIISNTPVLIQILLMYLGLPEVGIRLTPVVAAVIALSLNNGAYVAEIVRGGLRSVPAGQFEAAAAIGLPRRVTFVEIVLPQAIRRIYPALTNQCILIVLGSSIASIIGAPEITQQVLFLDSRTYRTVELLAFLTITYGLLTFGLSRLSALLGRRLDRAFV